MDFNENFAKFSELQAQGLAPVRQFAGVAVDAFEKLARKNFALCGDVLEFAIGQAKLPVENAEPKALFDKQVASSKAFAELLTARVNEYVELGKDVQASAAEIVGNDTVEPVKQAAKKAA